MRSPLWDYPPYPYLHQVLSHCHKAGLTYMDLWKQRDDKNKVIVGKDEIRTKFLSTTHTFHHNLLLLAKEGLVNVDERPNSLIIELTGWDNEDEYDDDN